MTKKVFKPLTKEKVNKIYGRGRHDAEEENINATDSVIQEAGLEELLDKEDSPLTRAIKVGLANHFKSRSAGSITGGSHGELNSMTRAIEKAMVRFDGQTGDLRPHNRVSRNATMSLDRLETYGESSPVWADLKKHLKALPSFPAEIGFRVNDYVVVDMNIQQSVQEDKPFAISSSQMEDIAKEVFFLLTAREVQYGEFTFKIIKKDKKLVATDFAIKKRLKYTRSKYVKAKLEK